MAAFNATRIAPPCPADLAFLRVLAIARPSDWAWDTAGAIKSRLKRIPNTNTEMDIHLGRKGNADDSSWTLTG